MKKLVLALILVWLFPSTSFSHPGRQDSNGGHRDSRTGVYHCHKPGCVVPSSESSSTTSNSPLSIYVIDVGQGDSTLIVGPSATLLMDAGDNRGRTHGAEYVQSLLNQLGITELDYVVVSHYDVDHMGGFVTVGRHFHTSLIWNQEGTLEDPTCTPKELFPKKGIYDMGEPKPGRKSKARTEWKKCLPQLAGGEGQAEHISIDNPSILGKELDLGGGFKATFVTGDGFVIDNPNLIDKANSPNESSISLWVSGPGDFDFLVTGDLIGRKTNSVEDAKLEFALANSLAARGIDLEILRTGHHGAANATDDEFIKKIKPEVAIISVGDGNSHGHPHCSTVNNLGRKKVKLLLQTESGVTNCRLPQSMDRVIANGTIQIDVSEGNYTISNFGEESPVTGKSTSLFKFQCNNDGC